MNQDNLHQMRTDYSNDLLAIKDLQAEPIAEFKKWFQQALDADVAEPNAFSLATASLNGLPTNRIVLIKELRDEGIVFYTNYDSTKGQQIAENPHVAACFFWQPLAKQVRFRGICSKLATEDSDHYFNKRPIDSQIGAATSPQSQKIESKQWLQREWEKNKQRYGNQIKRPENWGGYIIKPYQVEFWQGQPNRLHDRFLYEQVDNVWSISRLAP